MLEVSYRSDAGLVTMGGGNHPTINITKISGLGLPSIRYDEIEFVKEDGVVTTGSSCYPRVITISGDVRGGRELLMRTMQIFYHPGELRIDCGEGMQRKIKTKLIFWDELDEHNNSGIHSFTAQFQADYPFFTDFEDTTVVLAAHKNKVTDTFTLPCVFTEITESGSVTVTGDKSCYGVITLYSKYASTKSDSVITLTNVSTGKSLRFSRAMEQGETVTIDLNTRRIDSTKKGRITTAILDDCEMSEFYLRKGYNLITFSTDDPSQYLNAAITFNNEYLMVVK